MPAATVPFQSLPSRLPRLRVTLTVRVHRHRPEVLMAALTFYLGNRNYASWSLRAWLALKATGVAFEEVVIPILVPGSKETLLKYAPSGKVPALHHGEVVVWDSLAICEYLAELLPAAALWPDDPAAKAVARSISAEM